MTCTFLWFLRVNLDTQKWGSGSTWFPWYLHSDFLCYLRVALLLHLHFVPSRTVLWLPFWPVFTASTSNQVCTVSDENMLSLVTLHIFLLWSHTRVKVSMWGNLEHVGLESRKSYPSAFCGNGSYISFRRDSYCSPLHMLAMASLMKSQKKQQCDLWLLILKKDIIY